MKNPNEEFNLVGALNAAFGQGFKFPKFTLGQCCATPGALVALEANNELASTYIERHEYGDWGTLDAHDTQANEDALKNGGRILSAYILADGEKIWIITEADRSCTTVLLPSEY